MRQTRARLEGKKTKERRHLTQKKNDGKNDGKKERKKEPQKRPEGGVPAGW
jgi:hypothetical protein